MDDDSSMGRPMGVPSDAIQWRRRGPFMDLVYPNGDSCRHYFGVRSGDNLADYYKRSSRLYEVLRDFNFVSKGGRIVILNHEDSVNEHLLEVRFKTEILKMRVNDIKTAVLKLDVPLSQKEADAINAKADFIRLHRTTIRNYFIDSKADFGRLHRTNMRIKEYIDEAEAKRIAIKLERPIRLYPRWGSKKDF